MKDGEIVFPVEAKGSTALVEGKVYKIELTQEKAIQAL
ncbi:MAG: sialidase family protein [Ignavibacteriales bacterium]|nr:sialidase family protein [Ignavibacteriales bacterium]